MTEIEVAVGMIPNPSHRAAPGPEHPSAVTPRGLSPVPAALLLAVIPLVLFGGPTAVSRATAPVPVKPVRTENVRVIRMDATTFRGRWMPINDLAPATVIHEVRGGDAPPHERTSRPVDVAASAPRPPAARIVRRASLRLDLCARHGMRKVTYTRGKWQGWRCRR